MNAFLPTLRKARGRIVQVSTWTASVPLPFNGPSGASKAAMEVFATVYRAELKRFGIDVVVAAAGSMKTGGPAKTAAALKRVADGMTPKQRELYGETFASSAAALNGMQNSGLDSAATARRVIAKHRTARFDRLADTGGLVRVLRHNETYAARVCAGRRRAATKVIVFNPANRDFHCLSLRIGCPKTLCPRRPRRRSVRHAPRRRSASASLKR
jgi:NAD(P)-dependent dehydrogenase (short-subunit alcohol dehydrogenase family)